MATIDAIKAALVHPPSVSTSRLDNVAFDPDEKTTENQNLGAKKKKKIMKARPGTEVSKASKSKMNKAVNPGIDQVPAQKVKAPTKDKSKAVLSSREDHIPISKRPKPDKPAGLSEEQLQKLNQALAKNKDPGLTERRALAKETNLSEYQVGGWFKKARNNSGEAGKKDVNRPHFLASKLVQPSDAKRHMEKNTAGRNGKGNGSKPDKKAKVSQPKEIDVEDKKTSFGGMISSLKPGSSKARKIFNQPKGTSFKKLDIPVLSSMNQILGVMQAVGGNKEKISDKKEYRDAHESKETSTSQDQLKKQSENHDLEVMVLDEENIPKSVVAEVIDIVDDDQAVEVDGPVDSSPSKVFGSDQNSKTVGKQKSKKQGTGVKADGEFERLNDSNEKLRKELKEKTKIIQNLEIKIPQMISEFTKCVSDKDEVISAKDKEIKTNKHKLANFEKDTKLLQNRNKNTSSELATKVKEVETLKKELAKDSKEKLEHLQKMEGLEAKVAKLLGVLAKKDEEITQLNVKNKELLKMEGESRKLLVKEKEVSLKLKSKDKDVERKTKARIQESNDKVKELEKLIKVKDQSLVNFKSNDSIKTKSTLDAQQKQIVKLRSTVKFQEKEILSLKEKESRLSVQVADLECENFTKSAELECKNAELDKIMNKVKAGKGSDRRKLSIYEATKDYIEKLKENRKLKANLKNQEVNSDATEVINVEEEDKMINEDGTMTDNHPSTDTLKEQMPLNKGAARPRVASLANKTASFEGNGEHLKNDSRMAKSKSGLLSSLYLVDLQIPKLVMRTGHDVTGPPHYPTMVTHQAVVVQTPAASMVSHVVSWVEGDTDMEDVQHKQVQSIHPAGRKIAYRSSTGQWGQVYRVKGMHKEVVIRRAEKWRASVNIGLDDDIIPTKKRKLLDLEEYLNNSITRSQDPHPDINEDHSTPVPAIIGYLITMASTASTQPGEAPGVQGSTLHSEVPGVQGSTLPSEVPGVQGSTGEVPGLQGSSGEVPGVQGSTGEVPGLQGSSGEVPGVQGSTMMAHRLYDCPTTSSYSSVTHSASIPSPSISFPSLSQHQTSSDKFSPLSHKVTGVSKHTSSTSLLSHQVAGLPPPPIVSSASYLTSHHSLDNPTYSFYSHQVANHVTDISPQDIKGTKRHFEEDSSFSPRKHKKRKLSGDQIVYELVLELVSEVVAVQNPQVISKTYQLQSFLAHQVYSIHTQSSFLPHRAVSTKPSLLSVEYSHLSHKVTPLTSPQAVSSSLLSHQASSTHYTLPYLQNVRISPPHSCLSSLLTHQVYNQVSHDIPLQSGHLSTMPETGRRKRMLEDIGDSPGKRKMVRLYTEVPSITASCKREREDDDACLPPAKRLKMCRVSGIILHYSPGTLLHTLPQPSVQWQVAKYQHRQALSDL